MGIVAAMSSCSEMTFFFIYRHFSEILHGGLVWSREGSLRMPQNAAMSYVRYSPFLILPVTTGIGHLKAGF